MTKKIITDNNIYNPEFVRNLFDEMSKSYDRMNYLTSFGFSLRWRKQFINKLEKNQNEIKVLDLMTGMGENWSLLKKSFPNSIIDALDYSDLMVEKANNKKIQLKYANLNVIHDNALENKLESNYYDIITCSFGLKTFDKTQIELLAEQVHRILKTGGHVSFIEISVPNHKLLKTLYGFYTGKIVPLIGKILLGNPENYKMLWKYTLKFRSCDETIEIFKSKGFKIQKESYFFNCSTGFYGVKNN